MRKVKGFYCPMAAKGLSHFFQKDKVKNSQLFIIYSRQTTLEYAFVSECVLLSIPVVDFFNRINLIYGAISEVCTDESCPTMSGGKRYEYHWCDGDKYKKPTSVPAQEYISLLMDWIESLINNEDIFPIDKDVPFPKNFLPTAKKILTRLFRVFVHVYIHHFDKLQSLGAEAHVNQCYKHFYYFVTELNLVERKELGPLVSVAVVLC
ncbi:unnamed protein product, partial [Porites evermanni]